MYKRKAEENADIEDRSSFNKIGRTLTDFTKEKIENDLENLKNTFTCKGKVTIELTIQKKQIVQNIKEIFIEHHEVVVAFVDKILQNICFSKPTKVLALNVLTYSAQKANTVFSALPEEEKSTCITASEQTKKPLNSIIISSTTTENDTSTCSVKQLISDLNQQILLDLYILKDDTDGIKFYLDCSKSLINLFNNSEKDDLLILNQFKDILNKISTGPFLFETVEELAKKIYIKLAKYDIEESPNTNADRPQPEDPSGCYKSYSNSF